MKLCRRWSFWSFLALLGGWVLMAGMEGESVPWSPPPPVCDLVDWGGKTYAFCYQPGQERTWDQARAACQLLGALDLIIVDTADESIFLMNEWHDRRLDSGVQVFNEYGLAEYPAWIGYTDSAQEGAWLWHDGEPAQPGVESWCEGEPNNCGGGWPGCPLPENCAATGWDHNTPDGPTCPMHGWNDLYCETKLPFVCELVD